jgi:radical SAM protein with 4Fe4S-binding SPASM domain
MIDMSLFRNIIDDLHEDLTYLTLYFQGEPYLHPRFTDLVQYASKRNIYTSASTNGHHLNGENAVKTVRSGLDKLIISIDGMEQNTYERYRIGGRLDRVLKGIDTLIDAKSKLGSVRPFIEAQFIVFGHNEHETALFTRMCRARGIKASIKTAQLYPHQDWEAYLPTNARYSRYERGSSGEMVVKNKLLNHCWRMWYSSVVTWDGSVVPCCFDKDASHSMGNVGEASFTAVWRGAAYDNFRRALLKGRKHIDICRNCTEGTRVWS